MDVLIYGNEPPRIGFTQSPEGGISFEINNDQKIGFDSRKEMITWRNAYCSTRRRQYRYAPLFLPEVNSEGDKSVYNDFIAEWSEITGSKTEKKFFLDYAEKIWSEYLSPWDAPALIPQVWVNWIHYDPQDKERAERAQKEPFRVDFVMKDARISQHPLIIEVDGPSHFGRYSVNPAGKPTLHASMVAYTEHLRKDRWLRRHGWDVYRISSQEIDDYEEINSLFYEVFGRDIDGLPF